MNFLPIDANKNLLIIYLFILVVCYALQNEYKSRVTLTLSQKWSTKLANLKCFYKQFNSGVTFAGLESKKKGRKEKEGSQFSPENDVIIMIIP